MFDEINRINFAAWMTDLVQKSFSNMILVQQFECKSKMKTAVFDLLRQLQHSLNLNEQILVSGLCLVKRLAFKDLKLTFNSFYKLAVICIFIAHKFYSDFRYEIEDFSITSGVTIKDINELEVIALDMLEYDIILSERDYYSVLLFGKN